MKTSYRHYNHAIGLATVHLVWIPCRRKRVFASDKALKLRCIDIFHSVANENKWIIKALEVAPDHVHLLVEYDPHHTIAQVVKAFKGRSARILRQEFPKLLVQQAFGLIHTCSIPLARSALTKSWSTSTTLITAE